MRRKPVTLTDYGPPAGRFDAAVEWLLIAMLAFMPFAFGTVEPWSEFVAVAGATGLALLIVARRLVRPGTAGGWTWAYLPLALYVLLALLQLASLPDAVLRVLSPETLAAKGRLLSDLPEAGNGAARGTLSFYSLATRHDLRVVLIAATMFIAVVEVYRRPEQVRRLLLALTCVGGAVALLALAQQLSGSREIYWRVRVPQGVADGGPFINHNHFAQFMNLSIGAALGLLFVKLRDLRIGVDLPGSEVAAAMREPEARAVWACGAVFVAGALAIFLSMSRGGMVGMLVGLALVTAAVARRRQMRGQGWVVAALALAAFAGLLYFGFDAVYDRLASVRDFPEATGGRWELVLGAVDVWKKYPVLGTGLGTHAWIFPAYDRTGASSLAQYVENEYAQALEETGVLGLLLVLTFVAVVWANYFRAARAERPRVCAAAHGLAFGLVAVMAHSASDFGQHLPAVAGASAVTCGLLVVLARMASRAKAATAAASVAEPEEDDADAPSVRQLPPSRPRRWTAFVPAALALLLAWGLWDANSARVAASEAAKAGKVVVTLVRDGWDGSDEDYTELLTHAAAAAEARPDDVEYRYWLNSYRWRAIARERDPDTGDLLLTEDALDHTARIVDELHAARRLCPSYGPLVSLAGQLEEFVLERPEGQQHIALAYALAPNHPDVVFTAALADADRGDWDASLEKVRRCVALTPQMLREVIDVFETQYDRPDLAVAAAKAADNAGELLQLAQRLRARAKNPDTDANAGPAVAAAAEAAWAAGVASLERQCEQPDANPHAIATLANIYRMDGKVDGAVTMYRRALMLDYGRVEWRLELARILAGAGRRGEALKEAQICLRLQPTMEAAKRLVGDLSVPVIAPPATAPSAPGPATSR